MNNPLTRQAGWPACCFVLTVALAVGWQTKLLKTINDEVWDTFFVRPGNPAPSSFLSTCQLVLKWTFCGKD